MEKFFASWMSLLLLTAQFFLTTAECRADVPLAMRSGQSRCCRAAKLTCNAPCCVSRDTAPRDASTPNAPAPDSFRASFLAAAAVLTAFWTLPVAAELQSSFAASAAEAARAPAVPLFLRHGAMLI